MIIPDINILIFIHDSSCRQHDKLKRWWEKIVNGPEQIGIPWVVVLGFVRVLSNPRVVEHPRNPAELLDIIAEILSLPSVSISIPGMQHTKIMKELFLESGGSGRLSTDVHLAAQAIELDAMLASNDADFSRFSRLKWFNPLS